MCAKLLYVILLLFCFCINNGLSQGYPSGNAAIVNYEKEDYNASVSNWDIIENENGFIYSANNAGVLEYDGLNWRVLPLPNQTIVRSVAKGEKGRIYAGGQDEIGYFDSNTKVYTSIRDEIPKELLPLEDIWDLQIVGEDVFFRSRDRVYRTSNGTTQVIFTGHPLIKLFSIKEQVYFVDEIDGLFQIVGDENVLVLSQSLLNGEQIVDLLINDIDQRYVLTNYSLYEFSENRIVEIETDLTDYFIENRISCGAVLGSEIAIGTSFGGICLLNEEFKLDRIISIKEGLQNNSINSLAVDKNNNLWSASANGIECIYINSPKSIMYPDGVLKGSIYDMLEFENKMYYATNNGLYIQDLRKKGVHSQEFQLLEGTAGQVWGLDVIGGDLMMAHNQGAFIIRGSEVKRISPTIGAWKFVQAPDKDHMYVGTYFGVELYQKKNGVWNYVRRYNGLDESSRILVNGAGNDVWVSHPYRGVYLLKINEDFNLDEIKHFEGNHGLPSNQLNYIFDLKGEMLVAAERGVYTYNSLTSSFTANEVLKKWIDSKENVRHLQLDNYNRLWFIKNNEVGYIRNNEKTLVPDLVGKFVGGFEYLYVHSEDQVFACSDKGVFALKLKEKESQLSASLNVLSVKIIDTEHKETNFENNDIPELIKLNYNENSIYITFSSSLHGEDVVFTHKINDGPWSPWTPKQGIELINIKDGDYQVLIKTNAGSFNESQPVVVKFKINPPWYRSIFALLGYVCLSLIFIVLLLLIPKRKYQKDKEVLVNEKQETEAEVERLKNEQLQIEIEHQNTALASSTLHLVQKNTALNKVRNEIESVRKQSKVPEIKKELKGILSLLNDDSRLEDDWDNFSIHFDKVHADFLKRLKGAYPALSPKDQKLAAYLRMNLSTKEIAPLLNISVRGVEISRYRLRKKLEIDSGANLNEWMMVF